MDVRYYAVNSHGRSRLKITSDEEASAWWNLAMVKDPRFYNKPLRLVKETRETLFERGD